MPEASVEASKEGHGGGEGWMHKEHRRRIYTRNPVGHKPTELAHPGSGPGLQRDSQPFQGGTK